MGPVTFLSTSAGLIVRGGRAYWLWVSVLVALIVWGGFAYVDQLRHGLIVTNMRDQVSWAFYIGNFTFLVGVAAAAVVLVIPPTSTTGSRSRRSRSSARSSPSARSS